MSFTPLELICLSLCGLHFVFAFIFSIVSGIINKKRFLKLCDTCHLPVYENEPHSHEQSLMNLSDFTFSPISFFLYSLVINESSTRRINFNNFVSVLYNIYLNTFTSEQIEFNEQSLDILNFLSKKFDLSSSSTFWLSFKSVVSDNGNK